MLKYESYNVELKVNMYQDNKNLYVGLDYEDEDLGGMLPFGNITTNVEKLGYLEAAIDTNNRRASIINFLEENKLAENTGKFVYSGFCKYPVFRFSEEKLSDLCPYHFEMYKNRNKRGE